MTRTGKCSVATKHFVMQVLVVAVWLKYHNRMCNMLGLLLPFNGDLRLLQFFANFGKTYRMNLKFYTLFRHQQQYALKKNNPLVGFFLHTRQVAKYICLETLKISLQYKVCTHQHYQSRYMGRRKVL